MRRIDLTPEQVDQVKVWCAEDRSITYMYRQFGFTHGGSVRRAIIEHAPEYQLAGFYRGARDRVWTDGTLELLRRPKKKRAGPEGCWATRVFYYRQGLTRTNCQICGRPEAAAKKHHVDHCHETDRIRGLLCQGCNLHLGRWEKIRGFFAQGWHDTDFDYRRNAAGSLKPFRASLSSTHCQCCGRPEFSASRNRHHVDHNPLTGKIRGLLCLTCNVTLGWYERNTAAVDFYLKEVITA